MPDSGTTQQVAYRPARRLTAADATLRRQLCRLRGPLRLDLAGHPLTLWYLGEAAGNPATGTIVTLDLWFGGKRASLCLPEALIETLLRDIDPHLRLPKLDGEMLPILLQGIYADAFAALETACSLPIDLDRSKHAEPAGDLTLRFRCQRAGRPFELTLTPEPGLLPVLLRILPSLPPCQQDLPALPLLLELHRGAVQLQAADLTRLRPGDVILPHEAILAGNIAYVTLAGRWRATGRLAGNTLTLITALQDMKEAFMDTENTRGLPGEPPIEDATIDELPLKVVFEIGRAELTLGELRGLSAGYVFALANDPQQSVDLCIGGRRIGTGELVEVGEQLGVRVVRLSQDG